MNRAILRGCLHRSSSRERNRFSMHALRIQDIRWIRRDHSNGARLICSKAAYYRLIVVRINNDEIPWNERCAIMFKPLRNIRAITLNIPINLEITIHAYIAILIYRQPRAAIASANVQNSCDAEVFAYGGVHELDVRVILHGNCESRSVQSRDSRIQIRDVCRERIELSLYGSNIVRRKQFGGIAWAPAVDDDIIT